MVCQKELYAPLTFNIRPVRSRAPTIPQNSPFIFTYSYLADDYRLVVDARASLPGPTAPLVAELLQLPVPGYGTVYRHISEMLTYLTVGSGGH